MLEFGRSIKSSNSNIGIWWGKLSTAVELMPGLMREILRIKTALMTQASADSYYCRNHVTGDNHSANHRAKLTQLDLHNTQLINTTCYVHAWAMLGNGVNKLINYMVLVGSQRKVRIFAWYSTSLFFAGFKQNPRQTSSTFLQACQFKGLTETYTDFVWTR